MTNFIVIIPSRLSSTRLKEKALLDLHGKSLIERVYLRAIKSNASKVYIATDSSKIEDHVKQFTPNVIMTSDEHKSGTDRVYECATKINVSEDMIIVNVQGDEPFIDPETINRTAEILSNNDKASLTEPSEIFTISFKASSLIFPFSLSLIFLINSNNSEDLILDRSNL